MKNLLLIGLALMSLMPSVYAIELANYDYCTGFTDLSKVHVFDIPELKKAEVNDMIDASSSEGHFDDVYFPDLGIYGRETEKAKVVILKKIRDIASIARAAKCPIYIKKGDIADFILPDAPCTFELLKNLRGVYDLNLYAYKMRSNCFEDYDHKVMTLVDPEEDEHRQVQINF